MSHVEFSYSSTTLVANGPTFLVTDYLDLYTVGPSRGRNFTAAGAAGQVSKNRERDELPVDLRWFISGRYVPAGTASAIDHLAQVRHNIRHLYAWFDDAPGRQLTITLKDVTFGDWTAPAQFEDFGKIDWSGPTVQVRQLLTVNTGRLTLVPE